MMVDGCTGGSSFASVRATWVMDLVRSSSKPSVASCGAPMITRVIISRPPTDSTSPQWGSLPLRNRQYFIDSPTQGRRDTEEQPVNHKISRMGTNEHHSIKKENTDVPRSSVVLCSLCGLW